MRFHYHIKEFMFLVRSGTTDICIIKEVIANDTYGVTNQIKFGDIVIDVGAHIGSFAIYATSLGARVLAFEPATVNFNLLLENIELNGHEIETRKLGIMDPGGQRTLYIRDCNFGGSSFYTEGEWIEEVETITLKEVFDNYNVERCDFLKVDCEGAEYDILRDFPYFNRVKRIALEYVEDRIRIKIMRLLEQKGYHVSSQSNERMGCVYARRAEDEISV